MGQQGKDVNWMRLIEGRKADSSSRVQWVDVAKGTSIVLVVLLHSTNFLVARNLVPGFWHSFDDLLEPVRMPLFFLASGLFAQNILKTSWRAVIRKRVALFTWLYVLWVVLRFVYFTIFPSTISTGETGSAAMMLEALISPNSGLWFLYALGLYAVLAKFLARWGAGLSLTVGMSVALASPYIGQLSWAWARALECFVFFLLGLHCRDLVVTMSRRANWAWFGIAFGTFWATKTVKEASSMPMWTSAIVTVVISIIALVAGVYGAVLIQSRWIGRGLAKLGAITLPIYLMHEMILGAIAGQASVLGFVDDHPLFAVVSPAVLTAGAIATALMLHKLFRRLGAHWLFETPMSILMVLPMDPVRPERKELAAAA